MMCVCGHPYWWHRESGQTAPTAICHGFHGSTGTVGTGWTGVAAIPTSLRGCTCRGFTLPDMDARGNIVPRVTLLALRTTKEGEG